ncbi:MAG TPA: O-antigen ligase family protein, partial [Flavitalea sp.]|nr:O-antigen ligase family protein [Flavitalea sp.]
GLLFFTLIDGGWKQNIIKGFTNPLFLSFFCLFLIECAGLLYNVNMKAGLKKVETTAGLIALPFILITGQRFFRLYYERIMAIFCALISLASVFCAAFALYRYIGSKDPEVFFYHQLVSPLIQHAVYFSVFVLIAIVFLLARKKNLLEKNIIPVRIRIATIIWLIFFLILLSSKIMIITGALILIGLLIGKEKSKNSTRLITAVTAIVISLLLLLFMTDNPIRTRFSDALSGDETLFSKKKFSTDIYFNGVQFRLLLWRFAGEILNEHRSYIQGVSPGDAQEELNQKFRETNIYLGDPARGDTGFLNFNFHNQYLQALVESGILGLLALLINACWLFYLAKIRHNQAAVAVILMLFLFFLTESVLERQYGIFIYSFFPLLMIQAKTVQKFNY